MKPIIDFSLVAGEESDQSMLNMTWECVDANNLWLEFDVNYTNYEVISIHQIKDSMKATFFGRQYFLSEYQEIIAETKIAVTKEMPIQLSKSLGKQILSSALGLSVVSKSLVVVNLSFNMLLGGALGQLF
jgi:hypothetical protein